MKQLKLFITLLTVILWSSCRKDFETITSNGNLEFSLDTIYFDTLFTKIKSSTQQLKVYNKTNEAITIPEIYLERGENSKYQLNVDGLPSAEDVTNGSIGKSFTNVNILANDSIFIFTEVLVDLETDELDEDSFYNDKILFNSLNETQEVPLISLVYDANFIIQSASKEIRSFETTSRDENGNFISVEGYDLTTDQLNFTNEKAYVIYGNAIVPTGETLIIDAGARIHFHEDSGLIVENGASIQINGTESPEENPLQNQVIIESDRIAEDFDDLAGQWNFIWIMEGSSNNVITNTTIKNSSIGLLIEGNGTETETALTLRNVEIYNAQAVGIQANATNIIAENVVINQGGEAGLNIEEGGTYDFNHCTLVNYGNFGFSSLRAVNLSNSEQLDSSVTNTNLNANFTNCIITGNNLTELTFNNNEEAQFNFNFTNCLLNISETINIEENPEFNTENSEQYTNCIFNEDPFFKNTGLNHLQISEDSAANGTAVTTTNTIDIIGTLRDTENPDIGAYESIIFEDELEETTE